MNRTETIIAGTPRRTSPRLILFALLAAIALASTIVTALYYAPFCNGFSQKRNMDRAAKHIESHAQSILNEPRFATVQLRSYTRGKCGCLLVHGDVASKDDLAALTQRIAATNPTVEVLYQVTILGIAAEAAEDTGPSLNAK